MTGQNAGGNEDVGTSQVSIVFGSDVMPDKAIIHDDEPFSVQWFAFNAGVVDSSAFTDLLLVTSLPEGCPGSDDQEHPVVFSSDTDGIPQDFLQGPLKAGETGPLMRPTVGPFPAGSYRLTVTLAQGVSETTTFNCVEIVKSLNGATSEGAGEPGDVPLTGEVGPLPA